MIDGEMRAIVFHGARDMRLERVPVPQIAPGEALLRVGASSICGTDLRIYHGAHRMYPAGTVRIPGHEVAGEIVQVGSQVSGLQVGQPVFIAPNMGCGHCSLCVSGRNNLCPDFTAIGINLNGSFAEYMVIPGAAIQQGNLIPLSSNVDPAEAALIEPFACVLRGQEAVKVQVGDRVLVIGAGPIGIMHLLLANLRGASMVMISELLPDRLEQARRFAPHRLVNPAEEDLAQVVEQETRGHGMDVILIAAPAHRAQEQSLELAAIGGRINFFGGLPKDRPTITFNSNTVHYKELIVTGTTACSTYDCQRAADILLSGRLDLSSLVSARFALDQIQDAFTMAEDRSALKVVFDPAK
jgi:L-iditol 2-dehydrogenase